MTAASPSAPLRGPARLLRDVPVGGPLLALLALGVAFSLASPYFLTGANLERIVVTAAPLLVAACGATFVLLLGEIDLSVGTATALTGVVMAQMLETQLWPYVVVVGLLFATGIGLVNGLVTVVGRIPSFIVTLGTFSVAQGVAIGITGNNAVPVFDDAFLSFFADGRVLGLPVPVLHVAAVALACHALLTLTAFGRELVAAGGNPRAAALSGVRVGRVRVLGFVLAGVCVGLAAALLVAQLGTGTPSGAPNLTLNVIAAVVLGGTSLFGGRGSVVGTLVGGLLIATLANGLTLLQVSSYLQQTITGAIIVVAVLLDRGRSRA